MVTQKTSVLLTSSGAIGATSYIDCLKNNNEKRKIKIVCTDSVDQPVMHYKADSFHLLPKGNSKVYLKSLIKLCKKEKINVVIPCSGSEAFAISKKLKLLQSNGIQTNVPNYQVLKNFKEKYTVFKILSKNNIPVPKFFLVNNKAEFLKSIKKLGYPKKPICFKPSKYTSTGGAQGFRILRKENSLSDIILNQKPNSVEIDYETSLKLFQNKNLSMLVMEYLPGDECSVHVLAKNGKTLYCVAFVKKKAILGHSLVSVITKDKIFEKISEKIVKITKYSYNMNIQLKISSSGQPKVFEINPRLGGGVSLPVAAGVNFPYLAVKLALNEKLPSKVNIKKTKLIRYWKELFVINNKSFEFS